jgi:hypothetical protein
MSDEKDFTVTDRGATAPNAEAAEAAKAAAQAAQNMAAQDRECMEEQCKAGDDCQCIFPKVTFTTFILSLYSSAMVHMGEVPEPESGAVQENLPLAKHTIDILSMLKEKTCKCLDDHEARLIEGLLYELRMNYVMKTR